MFLDEIGELPMAMQVKLLRVLEERQVLRVGGVKPRPIDVRFVAATNRDLEAEMSRGAFRQDLFFRLNGVTLVIPPLRERVGGNRDLAREFIEQVGAAAGRARAPEFGAGRARADAAATPGPATSASCATRSNARCCSPATDRCCASISRSKR